jgi:hypothetical protein
MNEPEIKANQSVDIFSPLTEEESRNLRKEKKVEMWALFASAALTGILANTDIAGELSLDVSSREGTNSKKIIDAASDYGHMMIDEYEIAEDVME